MRVDGLILAGGKSRRMEGFHKGDLKYRERTFTECLIQEMKKEVQTLWISYGKSKRGEYPGCKMILDEYPDCGPIGGIHSALKHCENEWLCVAACDMPFLRMEWFQMLWEKRKENVMGIVPVKNGKVHPLAAIYRKDLEQSARIQIVQGQYRMTELLKQVPIRYVDVTGDIQVERMLYNVNTREDYEQAMWITNQEECGKWKK